MPHLAIIIVSWNTRDLLDRCIESVHASLVGAGITYQLVVVDNASRDGTPEMVRTKHRDAVLLESGRNLGFAGGNNLALRFLLHDQQGEQGSNSFQTPSYILLLNPDTEVVGNAIPRLVQYLEQHPDVALVGPQLRYPDGDIQSSRRRFPKRGVFFFESTPIETYWPNNPWARHYRMADQPDDGTQNVDWLVGAALLVRREAIERAGLMDAGFLMYTEELEWQQRIQTTGKGIVYLPEAVIIHHEGKSSEQAIARRYINFQNSRLRYVRMVYGEPHASILRLFLQALYGGELLVEAAKWLMGHKRPLRSQRITTYRQVIRSLHVE
jgi:GT2 family glycosyltransferase